MRRISCALLTAFALATSLRAQTTANGSISGGVADEQGGVTPGVSISALSATVPGVFTTTSGRDGRYRLIDLPPGDYTVIAELQGFANAVRSPVAVRAGLNLTIDIVMRVGGIDEAVEVVQETPLLESRTAVRSVNVSGEMLRTMPLSERREWFGALTLAPGVTTADWVNNEKLIYVHGADSSANIVQIDGADMTPASGSLRYVGLSLDAIDDVQIKTAGLDASAPLGLGGIVSIATTSGTNRVKGVGSAFLQPGAWNDSNTPGGTSSTVDQTLIEMSLGAPLIKDKAWAFVAYRYTDVANGVSRTAAQLDVMRALVPGFRPFDSTNESHFWYIKLNAQPSPSQQVSAFFQHDVNPVTFADPVTERPRAEATGGAGASARWSSIWSNRITTRVTASYNDKRRDGRQSGPDEPLQRVFQDSLLSAGRRVGNGRLVDRGGAVGAWNTQPNSKSTVSFDMTWFAGSRLGSHELQTGVYAQPGTRVENHAHYPRGGFSFEEVVLRRPGDMTSGVVPFHRLIFDVDDAMLLRRRGQDYAFYIQDAWQPRPRVTVSAGVRIDRIAATDVLFDAVAQQSTEVGPRLGVNVALTSDTRHIAKGHWVRVHDQPTQTGASVGTAAAGQRDLYDLDLDGVFETTFITPSTFAVTANRSIDPDFHQPFIQEWGAGYAAQLAGRTTVGLDIVRRDYRDRPTLVETNGRYNGLTFAGYLDEAFNEIYRLMNNRWNQPVYTSLELSLTKRTARLQGIASYVRQWRHIAGTWQPNDPASFIQPAAFSNARGIGSPTGSASTPADANSLSGMHMTQRATASAQWQDHVVRTGVTYAGPWGLLLAGNYTFQSGAWSGPIITRVSAPDPRFGPSSLPLSNGRIVPNPLATIFRFAHPTRGEGQLTTPTLNAWNWRAGRRFSWRRLEIDTSLDVFNVTNNGADASFQASANQTFNPLFATTTFRQLPRSAQAVVRVSF